MAGFTDGQDEPSPRFPFAHMFSQPTFHQDGTIASDCAGMNDIAIRFILADCCARACQVALPLA
jgi:hypothetical protein